MQTQRAPPHLVVASSSLSPWIPLTATPFWCSSTQDVQLPRNLVVTAHQLLEIKIWLMDTNHIPGHGLMVGCALGTFMWRCNCHRLLLCCINGLYREGHAANHTVMHLAGLWEKHSGGVRFPCWAWFISHARPSCYTVHAPHNSTQTPRIHKHCLKLVPIAAGCKQDTITIRTHSLIWTDAISPGEVSTCDLETLMNFAPGNSFSHLHHPLCLKMTASWFETLFRLASDLLPSSSLMHFRQNVHSPTNDSFCYPRVNLE